MADEFRDGIALVFQWFIMRQYFQGNNGHLIKHFGKSGGTNFQTEVAGNFLESKGKRPSGNKPEPDLPIRGTVMILAEALAD